MGNAKKTEQTNATGATLAVVKKETHSERIGKVLSVKEILDRAEILETLRERYEKTKETKDKLKNFMLKEEGINKLEIQDNEYRKFSTSNPNVLTRVLDIVKDETEKSFTETEKKLIDFKI
jgi:hypothetical protein